MTDNEIIKALKDEIRRANYIESYYIDCVNIGVFQNALNLINRQKEENEELEETRYELACIIDELLMCIAEGKETKSAKPIDINEIKSEAIIKFWERLKEEIRCEDDCGYHCNECHFECKDYVISGDNLVKEMTEEEE